MTHKITIEMILEGIEADDVVIATLQPAIDVTGADDEESLQSKVYESVETWWAKTGNVGCIAKYNMDELIALADQM